MTTSKGPYYVVFQDDGRVITVFFATAREANEAVSLIRGSEYMQPLWGGPVSASVITLDQFKDDYGPFIEEE